MSDAPHDGGQSEGGGGGFGGKGHASVLWAHLKFYPLSLWLYARVLTDVAVCFCQVYDTKVYYTMYNGHMYVQLRMRRTECFGKTRLAIPSSPSAGKHHHCSTTLAFAFKYFMHEDHFNFLRSILQQCSVLLMKCTLRVAMQSTSLFPQSPASTW